MHNRRNFFIRKRQDLIVIERSTIFSLNSKRFLDHFELDSRDVEYYKIVPKKFKY